MTDQRVGEHRARQPRLRPKRVYVVLAVLDLVIVGGLLSLALVSRTVPTLAELGPVATAVTALVALNIGVVTVNQKRVADARDAWWGRAQWALEQSTSENVRARMAGQLALAYLAGSDLATEDDLALLTAIPDSVIARVEHESEAGIVEDDIRVVVDDLDDPDELGVAHGGTDREIPGAGADGAGSPSKEG